MTMRATARLLAAVALVAGLTPLPAQEGLGGLFKKVTGKAKEVTEKTVEPKKARGEAEAPVATLAKAVVTKAPVKDFAAAQAQAVTSVGDGDPVYLCVELPEPVENYLARYTYSDDMDSYKDKVLELAVGPLGRRNQTYQSGYFLPRPEELKSTFLCINLAPGAVSRQWLGIWLKAVGGGREGVWKNEIRVIALGKTEATTSSESKVLAVAPLTAEVPSGVAKYQALAKAYEERHEKGDASVNQAPVKGSIVDNAARARVLAEAKNQNQPVEGFYFTDNEWGLRDNELGRVDRNVAGGVVLFKRDGKNWIRYVTITRWKFRNATDVKLGAVMELSAEQYAEAKARAK